MLKDVNLIQNIVSYQVVGLMKGMPKGNKDNRGLISGLLTVSQVAEILNVHPNTVRHWSDIGIIKACRFGYRRDRRFRPEEIEKLISDNHSST